MTLTSQDLSADEIKEYKRIRKKFPNKVKNTRAQIVQSVIGSGSKVSKTVAKEIRIKILTNPEFNR